MSSPLPPKENALFKRAHKCWERKQFKNGLKFAKQILSNPKFSEHGETLSIKGLILNCMGKKDEAYENVRKGLKNDLKSSVCWYFYGLVQKSDKKYEEAIKCFRNAVKIDKDNILYVRDLSSLQIQMRDLEGFRESTYQIFKMRPSQRISLLGYAVACHLLKDYDMAMKTLNSFKKSVTDEFEQSEILLYHTMLLQESGDTKGAMEYLVQNQSKICDKRSLEETLANLYIQLEMYKNADEQICKLLQRNPDNVDYYELLGKARQCSSNNDKVLIIQEYAKKYPKSSTPKRLMLNFTDGEKFQQSLDKYMRAGLVKGVPSLFVDMRSLYKDPAKAEFIEKLMLNYQKCLTETGKFSEQDKEQEPITALLWTYYYLAQHYDYFKNTEKALWYINVAISHTPTLIELYVTKAKIYKHAGDVYEACRWMDEAQSYDTADRYINSKCAKYMLRANLVQEAINICSNFTNEGEDVLTYLNDIECMSFQLECSFAYKRMENWGESLKKCHEIDRHFTQIVDDQVDFHAYCLRKMTLRSYVKLLRLEDVLRSHRFYQQAAHCAIDIYIMLYDQPAVIEEKEVDNRALDLGPAELKKLKNKQRKAQRKAESQKARETTTEKREHHNKPRQLTDPDAVKKIELIADQLAKDPKPLEQAVKFLKPLQDLAGDSIETHLLSYEVYRRLDKRLLMLRSLKRAWINDKEHPWFHYALVHFCSQIGMWKKEKLICPIKLEVIEKVMEPILGGKSPNELNKDFLNKYKDDLSYILQGARVMYMLDPTKQKEALKLVTKMEPNLKSRTITQCSEILKYLKRGEFGSCDDTIEKYRQMCHEIFPLATIFLKPEEQALASLMKNMKIETGQEEGKPTDKGGECTESGTETEEDGEKKLRDSRSPRKMKENIKNHQGKKHR